MRTCLIMALICCVSFEAKALEVPDSWIRAESNPNYAFRIDSYQLGKEHHTSLSLMDLARYEKGDYDKAVVELVDSEVIESISPVFDVSPDGETVVFQVVARAGGGLLDSVIFMTIPDARSIQDLVLNNIFSDGVSKEEQEIYKITDIDFKSKQNRDIATLSYQSKDSKLKVDYDSDAAVPMLGQDLESRVLSFYGGKLPVDAKIDSIKTDSLLSTDKELVVQLKDLKHKFIFDDQDNIVVFKAENNQGETINFTRYFQYGSLISQETYNQSGNKIFSSSALDSHAYNAGDFAYFAYAKELSGEIYDENLSQVEHSYGGHLKSSIAGLESRMRFLN